MSTATDPLVANPPALPLASLFGCKVAVAQAVPAIVDGCLYADELSYIAQAVPKRRAEFGTARVCARRALADLGFDACSLVPYPDRSPRWPRGVVGSISHTDGYCAVAVSLSSHASGLGLDVERDDSLHPDLEAAVCTARERHWLEKSSVEHRGRMAKLFFSAKEAFYKCQYSTTRTFLDFHDVELDIDLRGGRFSVVEVHRSGAIWRAAERASGRLLRASGFIVTVATLACDT